MAVVDHLRHAPGFLLGWHACDGDVARAIRQDDNERHDLRIAALGRGADAIGGEQARGEGRLAADRHVAQRALRQLHARRGREHDPRFLTLEHDQPDLVAALVRVVEQREHRALRRLDALRRGHAP